MEIGVSDFSADFTRFEGFGPVVLHSFRDGSF